MATFGVDNHFFIVLASLILIYFLWMDLALYYKLQSGWEDLLIVQTYENLNATSGGVGAVPPSPTKMAFFDPFNPISVKLLMVDHANHYVYYSACWWLDTHLLHIADKLSFITPDMISMSHVVVAALGARLIVADSINQRRLGVVLFEMRSLLDSYDGMVARARSNTVGMSQANGGWGYWMDGICDAIGTVFFFLGAWVLLQKRSVTSSRVRIGTKSCLSSPSAGASSAKSSSPSTLSVSMSTLGSRNASTDDLVAMEEASPFLASSVGPGCGESGNTPISLQRVTTVTVLLLLGQQFISSFLWNRYMHGFHELLEVPYQVKIKLLVFQTSYIQ